MAFSADENLPKDAVILNETEATAYVWDLVSNWNSLSETWGLRYGPVILGGINAFSGLIINKHYRTKLRLGTYGHFSSIIPIVALSGSFTTLFHRHVVSTQMLLLREACPICYEIKSNLIQSTFGIVYPMVLAPASAFMFAHRYDTCRFPSLKDKPKELFKFWMKITKPFIGTLVFMGVFQLISSSIITYFELRNTFTLRKRITEIEKTIDSKLYKNNT